MSTTTKLFSDLFPFGDLLKSSELFSYLTNIEKDVDKISIQEVPANFEKYIEISVGRENKILIDKAFGNIDNLLGDLGREIDEELENCTTEYDVGCHGNYYISDWTNSERYDELVEKKEWIEKLSNLSIWSKF